MRDTDSEAHIARRYPELNRIEIPLFVSFYKEKKSIEEDLLRAWNLLLYCQTLSFLKKGIRNENPMFNEEMEEEEYKVWKL